MSLVKKTDVKNHLSSRHRTQIHLCQPESQPDATGFSIVESGAAKSAPFIFAEDFVAEHSSCAIAFAPDKRLIISVGLQEPAASSSVQP